MFKILIINFVLFALLGISLLGIALCFNNKQNTKKYVLCSRIALVGFFGLVVCITLNFIFSLGVII